MSLQQCPKTMYKRTRSTAALKNSSSEGVGQTKDDGLVYVCPRAEVGWRTGITADWHYTNTPGLFLPPVCNSAGTSVPPSILGAAIPPFSSPAHRGELRASSPHREGCNDAFETPSAKATSSDLFCSALVGRHRRTFALTPEKYLPYLGEILPPKRFLLRERNAIIQQSPN